MKNSTLAWIHGYIHVVIVNERNTDMLANRSLSSTVMMSLFFIVIGLSMIYSGNCEIWNNWVEIPKVEFATKTVCATQRSMDKSEKYTGRPFWKIESVPGLSYSQEPSFLHSFLAPEGSGNQTSLCVMSRLHNAVIKQSQWHPQFKVFCPLCNLIPSHSWQPATLFGPGSQFISFIAKEYFGASTSGRYPISRLT